jgi:hypothetical protein
MYAINTAVVFAEHHRSKLYCQGLRTIVLSRQLSDVLLGEFTANWGLTTVCSFTLSTLLLFTVVHYRSLFMLS